jgi:WD40 repeat protein
MPAVGAPDPKPEAARDQGAAGRRSRGLLEENGGWIDGKFRLLEKLGEGGFGLVYKAEQVQPIQRLVAVKILKAGMDTRQVIARFDTERQSLARMEHPNIARVLDAGETERGQPYFVMELVRGRSITSYAKRQELDLRQRIALFIPVCQAVNHAHQKGIIHRDLKPSNILVMEEDGHAVPKVIDFGIAKVLEQKNLRETLATGMDQLVGTPGYISPEQIEHGSAHVDTRSDVYALGSILLELLSGRGLVSAADLANRPLHQILRDQVELDPPRPSTRAPELKGDLDWIILKALERDPARRYGNADELAEDLRRYLDDQPVRATPPSRGYLLRKFVKRHRVGVAAAVAVALAVLAGGVVSTALFIESEKNRRQAQRASSISDGRMAAQVQLSEPPDYPNAVALLCRALRTDAENSAAVVNLLSLLEHAQFVQPITGDLLLPEGADEARLVEISRSAGIALAVSKPAQQDVLSFWSLDSGARQDHPLPAGVRAMALAVSRDGRHAFVAQDDGQVIRWTLADGTHEPLAPALPPLPDGRAQSVLALALSGDGMTLAAAGEAGALHVWDLRRPKAPGLAMQHPPAAGRPQPIDHLALDYLGTLAATAGNSGLGEAGAAQSVVAVWDLDAGQLLGDLLQLEGGVGAVAVHRESGLLAVGQHDGVVSFLDFRAQEEAAPALRHPSAVICLAFSSDASKLLVGDGAGYLHTWRVAEGRPESPAQRHDGELMALHQALERGQQASISRHGEVRVRDTASGGLHGFLLRHPLIQTAMSPDAALLITAARSVPAVRVWRIYQRRATRRLLAGPEEELLKRPVLPADAPDHLLKNSAAIAWNATSSHVALADQDGNARVWLAPSWREAGPAVRHPPAIGALAISGDGSLFATSGRDQQVRLWQTQTGQSTGVSLRLQQFATALALSPDGHRLLTLTEDGEARVWDAQSGQSLSPPIRLGPGVQTLGLSPDGRQMIYRQQEQGWFSLPMPPLPGEKLPGWFLDLAETIAGLRLTPEGRLRSLDLDAWRAALTAMPTQPAPTETTAWRWAQWLLAPPEQRRLHPSDDQTLADYLHALRESPIPQASLELNRLEMDTSQR